MSGTLPTPRSTARIASSRYGTSSKLTMKPEVSFAATGSLPSDRANAKVRSKVSAEVVTVRTTSTSGMSGTGLKKCRPTKRGDRFVGLHFFNPVPLMPLVEVVRTVTTSEETFERAFAFARSLGKEPVAAKDTSGFIVNLLLVPYLLDAIRAVERGVGSVPDIDKAMQLGCGYPMGPLTLLDFVGLDTTYKIAEIMFTEYREQRYAPPPLLKRMVLAGMNGRKSGKGFYDYSADPPKVLALGV